jgi:hypothetical protein
MVHSARFLSGSPDEAQRNPGTAVPRGKAVPHGKVVPHREVSRITLRSIRATRVAACNSDKSSGTSPIRVSIVH